MEKFLENEITGKLQAQDMHCTYCRYSEAVVQSCSVKKIFLETPQNSQENTCARVSFLIKLQVFQVPTLVQVFSCEFCEISENIFFHRTPLVATSGYFRINLLMFQ